MAAVENNRGNLFLETKLTLEGKKKKKGSDRQIEPCTFQLAGHGATSLLPPHPVSPTDPNSPNPLSPPLPQLQVVLGWNYFLFQCFESFLQNWIKTFFVLFFFSFFWMIAYSVESFIHVFVYIYIYIYIYIRSITGKVTSKTRTTRTGWSHD